MRSVETLLDLNNEKKVQNDMLFLMVRFFVQIVLLEIIQFSKQSTHFKPSRSYMNSPLIGAHTSRVAILTQPVNPTRIQPEVRGFKSTLTGYGSYKSW